MLSERGASRAGRLRRRLVLEKAEQVPDGAGGHSVAWIGTAVLAADLIPLAADERVRGEGLIDTSTHRIIVRWRDDVAPGDRLRDVARHFYVSTVHDPDEDRRYLVLRAEEQFE